MRIIMYSMPKYNELRKQFGNFASWAIWDKNKEYDTEIIDKNINFIKKVFKDFQSELDKICFNPQKGKIILLGDTVQKFFKKHFKLNDNDPLKKCILNYKHYGCWGTDKDWVEGLWDKLVIKYKVNSFENIKKLYK